MSCCCTCVSAHHGSAHVEQWEAIQHILSLCASLSVLVAGGGEADLLGMGEIRALAAFAKQHMKKSHSVRLSDLDTSKWGCIKKNAGACRALPVTMVDFSRTQMYKPRLKSKRSIALSCIGVVLCVQGSVSNPTMGRSVALSCSQ